MINAEELKELIEKEATIYNVQCDNLVRKINFADKSEGTYVVGEIESINSSDFVLELNNENENVFAWTLEQLYKTKAEAEFVAKYGNVQKTVKMPVPHTWEELVSYKNESDYYSIRWCQNIFEIDRQYLFCISFKSKTISLRREVDGELNKYLIDEKLTQQNYYKALDKMVELWREEI